MVVFVKRYSIPAKVVVIGKNGCYRAEVVVFGK